MWLCMCLCEWCVCYVQACMQGRMRVCVRARKCLCQICAYGRVCVNARLHAQENLSKMIKT